jgi:hypothetical protein
MHASGQATADSVRLRACLTLQHCRINCQICKRPLNERPGKKKKLLSLPWGGGSSSSSSSKGHSTDFLVCDCCQRCYHRHCCKQRGISTKEREGIWFHDSSCQDCQQRLQDKVGCV